MVMTVALTVPPPLPPALGPLRYMADNEVDDDGNIKNDLVKEEGGGGGSGGVGGRSLLSLLGTRPLLELTAEYHIRQRIKFQRDV